ncbi:hypothetical protein D5086_006649, partial [Populus alba]
NGKLEEARVLFEEMEDRNVITWTTMIAGYCRIGDVQEAYCFFCRIPERNVVSWTAMISGFTWNGYYGEATSFLLGMLAHGVPPLSSTYAVLFGAAGAIAHLDFGRQLHNMLMKTLSDCDLILSNSLISMYAKCGEIHDAYSIFTNMIYRDLISWNTMIMGLAHHALANETLKVFQTMLQSGTRPNSVTFLGILSVCADIGSLREGQKVHALVVKFGFELDLFVRNSFIRFYSVCGRTSDARMVFDNGFVLDLVSWNSMIDGYVKNGELGLAREIFDEMYERDIFTWNSMISGCKKYSDCLRFFDMMVGGDFVPDAASLAGLKEPSEDLTRKMHTEVEPTLWGDLLSACRAHCISEPGEILAKQLIKLFPNHVVPYLLLSNTYATEGRWDDVENLRTTLKNKTLNSKMVFTSRRHSMLSEAAAQIKLSNIDSIRT